MSMWCEKNHLCEDFSVEIDWEVKLAWSLITFTIRFPILPSDQKTLETREIYRAENLPDTFYDCGGWFDWRKIWELDNGVEVIHPCTSLDLDWIHFQNLAENLSQVWILTEYIFKTWQKIFHNSIRRSQHWLSLRRFPVEDLKWLPSTFLMVKIKLLDVFRYSDNFKDIPKYLDIKIYSPPILIRYFQIFR